MSLINISGSTDSFSAFNVIYSLFSKMSFSFLLPSALLLCGWLLAWLPRQEFNVDGLSVRAHFHAQKAHKSVFLLTLNEGVMGESLICLHAAAVGSHKEHHFTRSRGRRRRNNKQQLCPFSNNHHCSKYLPFLAA